MGKGFCSATARWVAGPVDTHNGFTAEPAVALLQMKPWQFISAPEVFSYDVAADGKRSLINARLDESNAAPGAENSPNNDSWFG
jgi:hypothetical protein